jgi:hypothetical protein
MYEGDYSKYQEGGSSYYPHGSPGLSYGAGTSTSARYPDWYYPLKRYISYGVDQAEWAVEGIRRMEHTLEEFVHVQMELRSLSIPRPTPSIASSAILVLILTLKSCKDLSLGEESGCSSMRLYSFHSISYFSVSSSLVSLPASSLLLACILAAIIF